MKPIYLNKAGVPCDEKDKIYIDIRPDSNAELEARIAALETKNAVLEANMKVILEAIKNGKIN